MRYYVKRILGHKTTLENCSIQNFEGGGVEPERKKLRFSSLLLTLAGDSKIRPYRMNADAHHICNLAMSEATGKNQA